MLDGVPARATVASIWIISSGLRFDLQCQSLAASHTRTELLFNADTVKLYPCDDKPPQVLTTEEGSVTQGSKHAGKSRQAGVTACC